MLFRSALAGLPVARIGEVTAADHIDLRVSGGHTVSWTLAECFSAWHAPLAFSAGKEVTP